MTTRTVKGNADTPTAEVLVRILTESYRGPAWHGASVRSVLRAVDPRLAGAKLGRDRPTIHEQMLHIAYARHRVLGRLRPEAHIRFPRKMRNAWWPVPADAASWKTDLELLDDYQQLLLAAVRESTPAALRRRRRGARHTIGQELLGIALHDSYHSAQIRLTQLTRRKA